MPLAGSLAPAPLPAGHLCLPWALLILCPGAHGAGLRLRRWQLHTRLHRAFPPPARIAAASDAWPLTFPFLRSLSLVRPFALSPRPDRPATRTTTASADFSLRPGRRPFRHKARSPQVRVAHLHRTTAAFTSPRLGHKSFAGRCPLALLGIAFYAVLVHRLAIYAPRFLPTLGHPHAVALHFTHCDQLVAGLSPTGVRPCWAHNEKAPHCGAFARQSRRGGPDRFRAFAPA